MPGRHGFDALWHRASGGRERRRSRRRLWPRPDPRRWRPGSPRASARIAFAMAAKRPVLLRAGAQARARARPRAPSRPISRMVASSVRRCSSTALSGAFMALIRLAFASFYHVRRRPGEAARRARLSTCNPQHSCSPVTEFRGTSSNCAALLQVVLNTERVPCAVSTRQVSRLPKRFPVGTTYVVEGPGGDDGNFRVFSRYVVLPGGQRINVPADLPSPPAPRAAGLAARKPPQSPGPKAAPQAAAKKSARRGTTLHAARVDVSGAGRSPPAPHPQSPGVEPRLR